jgi:hypothetical protein
MPGQDSNETKTPGQIYIEASKALSYAREKGDNRIIAEAEHTFNRAGEELQKHMDASVKAKHGIIGGKKRRHRPTKRRRLRRRSTRRRRSM